MRVYLARNLYKKRGTLGSTPKRFDPLASVAYVDFDVLHPEESCLNVQSETLAESRVIEMGSILGEREVWNRKTRSGGAIRATRSIGNMDRSPGTA